MVLNKEEWTPFANVQDQINHYRHWGLIPPKGTYLPQIMVVDGYFGIPEPCTVVGYQGDNWAAIEMDDGIHVIHGDYLAELQPRAMQKLPRGAFFADILRDYVVFDIETTGFDRSNDEIIEIAAIRYSFSKEVDRFHTMVKPNSFIPLDITDLTGISEADVANAPTISEAGSAFLSYVAASPLVGHNIITFDIPFLSFHLGIEFENAVIDTLPMAREAYPLLSRHKLSYLKDVLALNEGRSHRATDDVETTNALLWACLAPRRYETKMWVEYLRCKTTQADEAVRSARKRKTPSKTIPKKQHKHIDIKKISPTTPIDPASPLLDKCIVFTGDLSIPREDAMQAAVNAGAILKTSVSKKVSYLIVGKQDRMTIGGTGMSTKEKKAKEINQSGLAHIEILDEEGFLSLLQKKEVTV